MTMPVNDKWDEATLERRVRAAREQPRPDAVSGPYPAPTRPGVYWAQWSFGSNPPKIERVVRDKNDVLCIEKGTVLIRICDLQPNEVTWGPEVPDWKPA